MLSCSISQPILFPPSLPLPHSRWKSINWDEVLEKGVEADHLFLRSGLIRKDRVIRHAGNALPPSFIVTTLEEALQVLNNEVEGNRPAAAGPAIQSWVCKLSDSSNAFGLIFVSCQPSPVPGQPRILAGEDLLHEAFLRGEMSGTSYANRRRACRVLQRYVEPKLIYGGHKFHLRCLVLVRGVLTVHLHEEVSGDHMHTLFGPRPRSTIWPRRREALAVIRARGSVCRVGGCSCPTWWFLCPPLGPVCRSVY